MRSGQSGRNTKVQSIKKKSCYYFVIINVLKFQSIVLRRVYLNFFCFAKECRLFLQYLSSQTSKIYNQIQHNPLKTLKITFIMSSFTQFKKILEDSVVKISTQMSTHYGKRCNGYQVFNSTCQKLSIDECKGTDHFQCVGYLNKMGHCLTGGVSMSASSGVRLPSSLNFGSLSRQESLMVCASASLDDQFKYVKYWMSDKIGRAYFGSNFGLFRGFPAYYQGSSSSCSDYDPRFRPWYVAATSGSKNIVLIIDVSGSMSGSALSIAKQAATSVINTLGLGDFVGVIKFSDNATKLSSQSLIRATKYQKQQLIYQVEALSASGATNYEQAFIKAQQMFKQARSDELGTSCQNSTNIVLFLTDGKPTAGEQTASGLMNMIDKWDREYNIKLFTYGLGQAFEPQILKQLCCKYDGIMKEIRDSSSSSQLVNIMSSYYTYISEGINLTSPVWSEPYDDFNTNKRMVTVSMPVYYTQNSIRIVLGVAAIDVTIDSLAKNFDLNEYDVRSKLQSASPCTKLSLNACQLQFLRPDNSKCGITGCPSIQYSSSNCAITNIMRQPFETNSDNYKCCGITIGALVGIIIGSIISLIILILIIKRCCCVKSQVYQGTTYNDPTNPGSATNFNMFPPQKLTKDKVPPNRPVYEEKNIYPYFGGAHQYNNQPSMCAGAP